MTWMDYVDSIQLSVHPFPITPWSRTWGLRNQSRLFGIKQTWMSLEANSTWREPSAMQKGPWWKSNRQPSCFAITVLTTAQPCWLKNCFFYSTDVSFYLSMLLEALCLVLDAVLNHLKWSICSKQSQNIFFHSFLCWFIYTIVSSIALNVRPPSPAPH